MAKLLGTKNPADILTKYKTIGDYQEQLRAVSVEVMGNAQEDVGWICLGSGVRWADALEEEGGEAG